MKKFLLLLLYGFATSIYADVSQQSGKVLIQNVSAPELYVFCNQKDSTLILDRVDFESRGGQAGWSSSLPPHMCSILLTDKGPLTFACSQEATGAFNTVNCQDVLLASRLPWSGQTLDHKPVAGIYWIVEQTGPDELIIMLHHRNIDT